MKEYFLLHNLKKEKNYNGWTYNQVTKYQKSRIEETAHLINNTYDICHIIGIGGSFLGAKAVIDALHLENRTDVRFIGNSFSTHIIDKALKEMEKKNTCFLVISKSGSTCETITIFNIFKEKLIELYGEDYTSRIFVISEKGSPLHIESQNKNYTFFELPQNIPGRYSVLSVAGLLPIAIAGGNIDKLLFTYKNANHELTKNALEYAEHRFKQYKNKKYIELFVYFEDELNYFTKWIAQLFAESEGKRNKGLYPSSLLFTRDLHSIGQFIQEGNPCITETFIKINKIKKEDNSIYDLKALNDITYDGVLLAHKKRNIPIREIHIEKLDESSIGKAILFFEYAAYFSASLFKVTPFDQPGVQVYKEEVKMLKDKIKNK